MKLHVKIKEIMIYAQYIMMKRVRDYPNCCCNFTITPCVMNIFKIRLLFLLTLIIPFSLKAQSDSLVIDVVNLDEITVYARNLRLDRDVITIVPTSREKASSSSGFSLLERIQSPLLKLNTVDKTIKLFTGEDVRFFINGIETTQEELNAIVPDRVKSIEILRNNLDPRFEGAPRVLNFILEEYRYGGYVSAYVDQKLVYNEGGYSLNAKFNKGSWTHQLAGGINYLKTDGDSTIRIYDVNGANPEESDFFRSDLSPKNKQIYNYIAWQSVKDFTKGHQLLIRTGLKAILNPDIQSEGFYSRENNITKYSTDKTYNTINPFMYLSFLSKLTDADKLKVSLMFMSTQNHINNQYLSANQYIYNKINEAVYSPSVKLIYNRKINNASELALAIEGEMSSYRTHYKGSANSYQKLLSQKYDIYAEWNYYIKDNLTIHLDSKLPYRKLGLNNYLSKIDFTPEFNFNGNLNISSLHLISLDASYSMNGRDITAYNDVDKKDTELEGSLGNTKLKPTSMLRLTSSYIWAKSNNFQLTFYAMWERTKDHFNIEYSYANNTLYSRMVNAGVLNNYEMSVTSRIVLLSNRLIFTPRIGLSHFSARNLYPTNIIQPLYSIIINYVPTSKFYIMAVYNSPGGKTYYKSHGGWAKFYNSIFKVEAGYNIKNFHLALATMPLYKWNHTKNLARNDYSQVSSSTWNKAGTRCVEFILMYNFDFGKHLQKDNIGLGNTTQTSVR